MLNRRGHNLKNWLFLLLLLGGPALFVWAQEDPFGVKDDKPATPDTTAPVPPPVAADDADEKDPIVLALRDANPTDPPGLMRALRLTIDIERFDEAAKYLAKLNNAGINDQQAFALQRQVGTGFLLGLASTKELGGPAKAFSRSVMEGAGRYARDPGRIDGLISQLNHSLIEQRTEALYELRALGDSALSSLIVRLSGADAETIQPAIQDTLIAWGSTVVEPMEAALKSDSATVRLTAMNVLGARQATGSAVWLARPALAEGVDAQESDAAKNALREMTGAVPSRGAAIQLIFRQWQRLESTSQVGVTDENGQVATWEWDGDQQTIVWALADAQLVTFQRRARLAEELLELDPEEPEFVQMAWQGRLELAKYRVGNEQPLTVDDVTSPPPAAVLEAILRTGMSASDSTSAIAAVELLAEQGDASMLSTANGESTSVVDALRHSDRRLRLAAARTIVAWKPTRSFAGSNRVAETLFYFVSSEGTPRVLIGHPGRQRNQTLVGLLREIGYRADAAQTGRELFLQARSHADYQAILISDAVDSPETLDLVQQLRKDPRTSRIPIGLLPRTENKQRAARIARDHDRIRAFPWPYQSATAQFELDELASIAEPDWPTPQERLGQAVTSMGLLAEVASQPNVYGFEDLHHRQQLLIESMYSPALSETAIATVGQLATPQAQRALLDFASQQTLPIALRDQAVDAFAKAAGRRGLLLTTKEIRQQYDRYNASEFADADTQRVLGRVLDVIEQPTGAP